MAKPVKDGILYFPLPVDFFHDPKIKRLERKFPAVGIRLYLKIRCDGHSRHGYYFPMDEDSIFNILDDLRIEETEFNQIVDFMIEKDILVEIHHSILGRVVTSKDMQQDFQVAAAERIKKRKQRDKSYRFPVDDEIWILETVPGQSGDNSETICECPDNKITDKNNKITEETIKKENTTEDSNKNRAWSSTDLSEYGGIPSITEIRAFISKNYPELDPDEAAETAEDAMVRYVENELEPIHSWKAFTTRICKSAVEGG